MSSSQYFSSARWISGEGARGSKSPSSRAVENAGADHSSSGPAGRRGFRWGRWGRGGRGWPGGGWPATRIATRYKAGWVFPVPLASVSLPWMAAIWRARVAGFPIFGFGVFLVGWRDFRKSLIFRPGVCGFASAGRLSRGRRLVDGPAWLAASLKFDCWRNRMHRSGYQQSWPRSVSSTRRRCRDVDQFAALQSGGRFRVAAECKYGLRIRHYNAGGKGDRFNGASLGLLPV